MKKLARAFQFFRPDSARLAGVGTLILFNAAAGLLKPWPLAIIVDCILGANPPPAWLAQLAGGVGKERPLGLLVLAILLLHAGQSLLATGQNYLSIQIGLRGLRRVRNQVFGCLQRLSLRFHQGTKAGDLIHRAAWDTYSFQTLFQQGFVTAATAGVSLALMIGVMFKMNITLTLVAAPVIPILYGVIRHFSRKMTERGLAAQQADSQVTAFVQQSIAALPLIQSYTQEEREATAFTARTGAALERRMSQHGWELIYWLAVSLVFALGMAGMIWFGSRQVLAGRLTVGELLIFLAYLAQLYDPLNQLSHVGSTVAGAAAGTQRVFEILDTPEEVADAPDALAVVSARSSAAGATTAIQARGNLEFEGVSFSYQPGQPVLQDVSFRVNAGQSVAIIGPSGVGKTTLLNLLPRFFDPVAGAIKLEGADLRQLRLKDVRAHVALVLQEPILLPASIGENIAYGRPNATPAEIESAARAANAHVFIEKLPERYGTLVGDGGARLSVGERQRLNLARAFLKDAPILLLDEPTSALDADSEAQVVASLGMLMNGRTTLVVAHRLTTISRVDKIIVLQDGRLIEEGSPAELLARGGYYARVASGQVALE